jgi:signal transduction histidine kinase
VNDPQPPLDAARQQLDALIEAARSGAIIPVRLPGQLEAIRALLDGVTAAPATPASPAVADVQQANAEFLKTAIHELRTPMTSIRGYTDMLVNPAMSGTLSDMQQQLLDVVRANARRMEALLTDMSLINKLRGGILQTHAKMDMFKNIALMLEKRAAPLSAELGRALTFDIPQGLPLLNTDGDLLATALYKLVENGLRYAPEGSGAVTVRGASDGGTLVIVISDNGIGMTPDELAQYGTLFWRGDRDEVRAHKGSGLGAAIARGLITALGGTLDIASSGGAGTTITVRLPGMT